MSIFNISFLGKPESADEFSNPLTSNSNFTATTKDSTQKETIAYICGLRTRIECEPFSEHLTHSDRVTNIGYRFFWGASILPAATWNLIRNHRSIRRHIFPDVICVRVHQTNTSVRYWFSDSSICINIAGNREFMMALAAA